MLAFREQVRLMPATLFEAKYLDRNLRKRFLRWKNSKRLDKIITKLLKNRMDTFSNRSWDSERKYHVFDFAFETSIQEKALDPELTPEFWHLMVSQ